MKIPIMDLGFQYRQLKDDIDNAIKEIAQASRFVLGKETRDFERDMANYCGVKYAVGVASGTDALILSLTALGIKDGDEVITTPFTFMATAEAISRVGAKPVFVDIDPRTYNIDPAKIKKAVTPRAKAIIAVHLYGNPCDMDDISKIAKQYKLKVIEDAAQAIGATYKGRKIGSFGDAGCLSFFPSKNLGAFGDAGMVLTGNKHIAEELRLLRVHGSVSKYRHTVIGFNSRLDNIQAAILSIKLRKLDAWTEKRIKLAGRYDSTLKGIAATPRVQDGGKHVYHLYIIRVKQAERDKLLGLLNENGIESRVYYPVPLHLQECYKGLGHRDGDLPEAETAALETLALPLFPELGIKEQNYVIEKVREFLK